jgi:bifunctional non-homologous end joining protein LigD
MLEPRRPPPSRPLKRYTEKRDFSATPEPPASLVESSGPLSFVVQKHWASRLHYDFRLELDGVLVSWAMPKGPSYDPAEKRMAVHVEDHPVPYAQFEGTIPKGQYGAGRVIVWDRGTWEPVGEPRQSIGAGKLVFKLHGEKLAGLWELVRIAKPGDKQEAWMLFKKRDAWARPLLEYDVISALPDSVVAQPLGPIEQRQPRTATPAAAASRTMALPARGAAGLPQAQAVALPATLAPQLASPADTPPMRGEWIYEVKFDGYRLLTRIDAEGRPRLITRNGHDWSAKLAPVAAALAPWIAATTALRSSWLDGEIVVLKPDGTPDFNALQNAIDSARGGEAIRYFLFDIPFADGHDLRRTPLYARRVLLKHLIEGHESEALRYSADFAADAASLLESARALGLEGLIAKRADAPYSSQRSDTWLKLKIVSRQELVVGGFTLRQGSSREVGSLILGVYDSAGALAHAGSVGTGWDGKAAATLAARLLEIEQKETPFAAGSPDPGRWARRAAGSERWVRPQLVAEVRFAGWTPAGHVRHAVFIALREDKSARDVRREKNAVVHASPRGGIKVSNPQRIIDVTSGLTKLDLVRYYESVGERMLPHLAGRPTSLVRGPDGVSGQLFFQKHDEGQSIPGLRVLDAALWPGHQPMLEVPSVDAIVAAAQMNVIEFHTWNSTTKKIDQPDRVVFDLDPGEGVPWERVQEAALLVRTLLTELKLACWLKTSGGKGLHVVVPITPRLDTGAVKAFAQAAVAHLARTIPSRFVAKSGPANRVGKVFVDYLRNSHGATTAAAYSARARPGLGVSMPVAWEELGQLKGGAMWNIATAREHLSFQAEDPWADCFGTKQTLAAAMKMLG